MMRFWGVEPNSQVICWSAAGFDRSNNGFSGFDANATFMIGAVTSGSGDLGFSVENTATDTSVAGWVQFTYHRSQGSGAKGRFFTIDRWNFNTGDVRTSIMMPATGPSAAVPGVGGLADLAMGAAGLRLKRHRVA